MMHAIRNAASAAVITMFAPAGALADCRSDLAEVDRTFGETLERLEKVKDASTAEKCAAYRQHVTIMTTAREVFQRCQSGTTQRENVGQMSDSIGDFEGVIRRQCGAP